MSLTTIPTLRPLSPNPPSTTDPDNFDSRADQTLATDLPNLVTDANAFALAANTLGGDLVRLSQGINAAISGGGLALDYIFDAGTADSDPGPGMLRLGSAVQNTSTVLRLDLVDANGSDQTAALTQFGTSTSSVKGYLVLHKAADGTAFIVFGITAVATPTGYRNVTATVVASSAANPFAAGDLLTVGFTRNGDKGESGSNIDAMGAPVAAASTTDLNTTSGNSVHLTLGTGTINAITLAQGARRVVVADAGVVITHGASLLLPGEASITTVAGDRMEFMGEAAGVVRCLFYQRKDGTAVAFVQPGLTLVGIVTVPSSAATVDLTSLIDSSADEWEIHFQSVYPATTGSTGSLYMRFSSNNGASFVATTDYTYANALIQGAGYANNGASADNGISLTPGGNVASIANTGSGVNGVVRLFNVNSTSQPKSCTFDHTHNESLTQARRYTGAGYLNSAAVINAVRFNFANVNIGAGSIFKIYKVKK